MPAQCPTQRRAEAAPEAANPTARTGARRAELLPATGRVAAVRLRRGAAGSDVGAWVLAAVATPEGVIARIPDPAPLAENLAELRRISRASSRGQRGSRRGRWRPGRLRGGGHRASRQATMAARLTMAIKAGLRRQRCEAPTPDPREDLTR